MHKKNNSKLWKIYSEILGNNKKKKNTLKCLIHKGTIYSKINDIYNEIGNKEKIIKDEILSYKQNEENNCFHNNITNEQIIQTINKIKSNCPGNDNIKQIDMKKI